MLAQKWQQLLLSWCEALRRERRRAFVAMMEKPAKRSCLLVLLAILGARESSCFLLPGSEPSSQVNFPWKRTYNFEVNGRTGDCEDMPLIPQEEQVSRRKMISGVVTAATTATVLVNTKTAEARPEAVNRPDLLPKEPGLNVIQIEKFLTSGQANRMDQMLGALEQDTGFRVRVLCQAYPYTPGLAIRDYWDLGKEDQKDDKYVVLVVDQFGGKGNVLNFNVGDGVKLVLPNSTYYHVVV